MKIQHLVIITVFLITSTVLLIIPQHAYASTCAVKETIYSAPEFYLLSDNVFVGNVTSITDYGNHQWQVHFNIEKIWKGTATRQTSSVMAHALQACGYSITVGEKYLIYTTGSPSTINPIFSKMYSDAQNDIVLFDDPKFQDEEKIKEDLNKKLEVAQGAVESMMMDKSSHIPINGVGVDEVNSTLDIMIDDERATLSVEQYTQNLKNILGDLPIKVEFGHATTALPILHNANDSGLTTSHPIIRGLNSSNVLESPLKQFKSGTDPYFVICNQNLQLVIKSSDNSPACVRPSSIERLLKQGWVNAYDNNGKYLPIILPNMIKVQNTNFTINYDITGNNKLIDANMYAQKTSLVLSLHTSSNGTLSVSIPRVLLDSNLYPDTHFIVLVDKKEVNFTETVSLTARTLVIPFEYGAETMEIIAPQRI